ncbi:MAG: hypothetical protein M3Q05_04690 [Bacteroidota bacterium]|nr:hypothetical protein [Bacteroidota bacterium]
MVYSAEIRWFFKSLTEVSVIENWFKAQQKYFSEQWDRTDIYLWQPDLEKHSVKIREGKVEVKVLSKDRGVVIIDPANSGISNNWVKYSFELKETDTENNALLKQFSQPTDKPDKSIWVRVDKERLLVKYALHAPNDSLSLIPENEWPDEGCGVELTRIKINQQEYYTFGLEAFSKTQCEEMNLEKVLSQLIPEININGLHYLQSHSYPSFLANLHKV